MRSNTWAGIALLALWAASPALRAQPQDLVSWTIEPVFDVAMDGRFASDPLYVEVTNRGPHTQGLVEATSSFGTGRVVVPLDLPSQSHKGFMLYMPEHGAYGGGTIRLRTSNGVSLLHRVESGGSPEPDEYRVLCVGGASGSLGFLTAGAGEVPIQTAYVTVERCPDRSIGFESFAAVVLAEGSERLADSQVRALRRYLLRGGSLVVVGGASPLIQRDPRWRRWFGGPISTTTKPAREVFSWKREGSITLSTGFRGGGVMSASGGVPLAIEYHVGRGRLVALAWDPFGAPVRTDDGRRAPLLHAMSVRRYVLLDVVQQMPFASRPAPGSAPPQSNPFMIDPPSSGTVTMMLLAYFILVVPVNMLVLRKLGKGEWAWVTTPLISLGFAALFFNSASALYRADMSSQTDGTLVLDSRLDEGIFVGQTRVFIPVGGTYDLGLESAEWLDSSTVDYGMGRLQNTDAVVDLGEMRMPSMAVPNLAFREIDVIRPVATAGWFKVTQSSRGAWKVLNGSPHTFNVTAIDDGKGQAGEWKPSTWKTFVRPPDRQNLKLSLGADGMRIGTPLGRDATTPGSMKIEVHLHPEEP